MLTIGFVDHHLNNYHANKFLALLHGPLAAEDVQVTAAWESDPTGDDWCAKNGVRRAESAAEVAGECDAIIVLAPDNVDAHLALCEPVLAQGKPTMVDKFLAPDLETARRIVDLAEVRNAPLFSASSLRFAVELEAALAEAGGPITEAYGRGMGEWDLYGVHTLSLVAGALGAGASRLIHTGGPRSATVTLDYGGDRRGWVDVRTAENQWEALPWSFGFRAGDRYVTGTIADFDGFYTNLMRQAVRFFKSGESPVSTDEMLGIVAVLEAAERSRREGGVWIDLPGAAPLG